MSDTELLAVVGVHESKRIRCQALACNQPVYVAIHVVRTSEGLKLLGSDCCARLFGWTGKQKSAAYTSGSRPLTDEERDQLVANTEDLLAKLKVELAERLEQDRQKLQALRDLAAKRQHVPLPLPAIGSDQQPVKKSAGMVWDPRYERQAKANVRSRYDVNPELPGWRGLVLAEMKKLQDAESGND